MGRGWHDGEERALVTTAQWRVARKYLQCRVLRYLQTVSAGALERAERAFRRGDSIQATYVPAYGGLRRGGEHMSIVYQPSQKKEEKRKSRPQGWPSVTSRNPHPGAAWLRGYRPYAYAYLRAPAAGLEKVAGTRSSRDKK